jgi:hypothetical protein
MFMSANSDFPSCEYVFCKIHQTMIAASFSALLRFSFYIIWSVGPWEALIIAIHQALQKIFGFCLNTFIVDIFEVYSYLRMKTESYGYILCYNFNKRTVTYCKPYCFFSLEYNLFEKNLWWWAENIKWIAEEQVSRRRMIWLLPPPLPQSPPSPVSKFNRRHKGILRKRDNLLTRGGGRRQIIRRRERLVLYNMGNAFWSIEKCSLTNRFVSK